MYLAAISDQQICENGETSFVLEGVRQEHSLLLLMERDKGGSHCGASHTPCNMTLTAFVLFWNTCTLASPHVRSSLVTWQQEFRIRSYEKTISLE